MPKKKSIPPTPWERFEASLDAPTNSRLWCDSLDEDAIRELAGEQRDRARAILLERLHRGVDDRIPDALVALDGERAYGPLVEALPAADGQAQVSIAHILLRAGQAEQARAALLRQLGHGDDYTRVTAASVLGDLRGDPGIVEALLDALDDPFDLVRLNARSSLFGLTGLEALVAAAPPRSELARLERHIVAGRAATRTPAIRRLRQILKRLERGASPQRLGILRPARRARAGSRG